MLNRAVRIRGVLFLFILFTPNETDEVSFFPAPVRREGSKLEVSQCFQMSQKELNAPLHI